MKTEVTERSRERVKEEERRQGNNDEKIERTRNMLGRIRWEELKHVARKEE